MNWSEIGNSLLEIWGKGGLILVLGFLIGFAVRRYPADFRHGIWLWVLVAVIAIPVVSISFPRWELIPAWWKSTGNPQMEFGIGSESIPVSPGTAPAHAAPPVPSFRGRLSWQGSLAMIWFAGAALILTRSVVAGIWLFRLRSKAGITPRRIRDLADSLQCRARIERSVEIITSDAVPSPFSWGLIHSRIALPAEAINWPSDVLDMALLHELEHIRRRDPVAVLLGRMVLAVNWLNPLSWLALRNIERSREEACDARVLASGYRPERYASFLLDQAKSVFPPIEACATAVAEHGTLERRIRMILNRTPQEKPMKTQITTHWLMAGSIIATGMLTGVVGWVDSGMADEKQAAGTEPRPQFILIQRTSEPEPAILLKLNGETVEQEELLRKLEALPKSKRHIVLGADESVPLEEVATVLELAKEAGVETVKFGTAGSPTGSGPSATVGPDDSPLLKKLKAIVIPKIEFVETPLGDAVAFLVHRSRELEPEDGGKGINVILEEGMSSRPVTLRLTNASLADALKFSSELAAAQITIDEHAVLIGSKKAVSSSQISLALADPAAAEAVKEKLRTVVIPNIEFQKTPLKDAIDFLRARSVELDADAPPEKRGVNIVLSLRPDSGISVDDLKVTLELRDIPLGDALKYTVQSAGLRMEVQGNAIAILPPKSD